MRTRPYPRPGRPVAWLAALALAFLSGSARALDEDPAPPAPDDLLARADRGLSFLPNRGQWDARARFGARHATGTVWLEDDGWLLTHDALGVALRFRIDGAASDAHDNAHDGDLHDGDLRGRDLHGGDSHDGDARGGGAPAAGYLLAEGTRPGRTHFVTGRGSGAMPAVSVAPAQAVRYCAVRPGVDVVARSRGDAFEYDLELAPRVEPASVTFTVEGALGLCLDADGALLIETQAGTVRQPPPPTWERDARGRAHVVPCGYVVLGPDRFGFAAPRRDPGRALIIDPVLEWSTFVGGSSTDFIQAVAVGADDTVTVAGFTSPFQYPVTPGAFDTSDNGGKDAFVTRLRGDGSGLISSTFLGGAGDDEIHDLVLGPDGGAIVVGLTASSGFPVTAGAHDETFAGGDGLFGSDAFVSRLTPDGSALVFSTFLGGSGDDIAFAVGLDDGGRIVVAGKTSSPDLPVSPGALDGSFGGGSDSVGDAFVSRLSADGGTLVACTYLGGGGDELVNALVVEDDAIVLAGWTSSGSFPVPSGGAQPTLHGPSDAFLLRVAKDLDAVLAGTFLGGASDENALALTRDGVGRYIVTGTTRSSGFPLTDGAPGSYAGGVWYGDAFVTRLPAAFEQFDFSTTFGGSHDELPTDLVVLPQDVVVVGGWSQSHDLPVTGAALDGEASGQTDGLLAVIDMRGDQVLYASYLGGAATDKVGGLGVLSSGALVAAGWTTSADLPVTPGAYDTTFNGFANVVSDAFVACMDVGLPQPEIASAWGELGPGLAGAAGVPHLFASGDVAGGGSFVLGDVGPSLPALLLLGLEAGHLPVKGGVLVPWPVLVVVPFTTAGVGVTTLPYGGADGLPGGVSVFVQMWVEDPAGVAGWAASNGVVATTP